MVERPGRTRMPPTSSGPWSGWSSGEGSVERRVCWGWTARRWALALRRKRLTARMNHAVQTLMAKVDDPEAREVMPLDRMESQIRFLLESMGEVEDLVEGLTRRVAALEEARSPARAEAESPRDGAAGGDGM